MPGMDTPSPPGPASPVARIPGLMLHPHDHVCAFVEDVREGDELIGRYLFEGLRADQPCLYLAACGRRATVLDMLDALPATALSRLLRVVNPESVFLQAGAPDLDAVFEFWDGWARDTFAGAGADATARIAVDMGWAHAWIEPSFIRHLVGYEARLTKWASLYPQVCLCVYALDAFGVSTLLPMIKSQPTVWLRGVAVHNPYHVDPEDVATSAAPVGRVYRSR